MAKAIMGSFQEPSTYRLLDEVRALRARVTQLERALADAEAALTERNNEVLDLSDADVVELDAEAVTA